MLASCPTPSCIKDEPKTTDAREDRKGTRAKLQKRQGKKDRRKAFSMMDSPTSSCDLLPILETDRIQFHFILKVNVTAVLLVK